MARLPRLNLPNIPQHVVQRGNNWQVSFFCEEDHTVYLDKLKDRIIATTKKLAIALAFNIKSTFIYTPTETVRVSSKQPWAGAVLLTYRYKFIFTGWQQQTLF